MTLPTPRDLGFPEKFDAWREPQAEALRWLLRSPKRVKAFCAPTGFGKTAVYVAYALMTKTPTCFVTDSRALQDQLMGDFASVGLVDLRGRSNYRCDMRADFTCEEGYAARCPYKGSVECPASAAEMKAASSYLVATNYAKWTYSRKFGTGLNHLQCVVFDEGHKASPALEKAMNVTLRRKEIEETLGLDFPSTSEADEFVNWKPWATETRRVVEDEIASAKHIMATTPTAQTVRHFNHMVSLLRRLNVIATANPQNWIADHGEKDGYTFDPIRAGRYAEAALLLRVPNIVIVSATLRPKALYLLGLQKTVFDFREFDSEFAPERCPIYYVPTMRVDSRSDDFSRLWILHDQIAARRTDRKSITHTVSYARRSDILSRSRFSASMIINEQGGDATGDILTQFRAAGPGTILCSPSVAEGFDFPMEECEWQFLCKIPFPNGRTKIHKARQEDDKEYGAYIAMNKMVQTFGRGMRRKEDRCENFIGDQHLDWFLPRFGHLAPKSFHGFFQTVRLIPPPAPKL